MVQGGWGSSGKTVTVGQKPLHPGHRVYGKTCWLIAWKESGALMYSTALSVCMQAHLSLRLPDLNGSTVCDHSDEGWRETDNSMEDTIRLDSAIPGMQWSMQLCQPPPHPHSAPPHLDTKGKMSPLTWGTFRHGGTGFKGVSFSMWFQPLVREGVWEASYPCKGHPSGLRSGDIHRIVREKHCLMPSCFFFLLFFSCVSSVWIGVQFVCLPSFIRKLKMLFVYRWPFFLFPPKQGWEKNTFAVFLSISWHFAFVQIHLYLFFSPLLSFFPLFLFHAVDPKEASGSVQAPFCRRLPCPVMG